ncbi:CDP-alcohol phosphatidyltransferase family protein [bacterium]|nr:CDP-alcohol phosphatidyltransferase family protein [bacterium]
MKKSLNPLSKSVVMPPRESDKRAETPSTIEMTSTLSRHQFWTVPNMISIGRILLLIPLFIFLRKGADENGNFWALVVMGGALLTDILDGLIARWFHLESDWGRVLDPIADKTWLGCLAFFLALPWRENPLAWEFLVLLLVRDLTIVVGAYIAYRETGIVMKSNFIGKFAMGLVAITLISYTIYWPSPELSPFINPRVLVLASSAMLILSGLNYLFRLRNALLSKNTPTS